MAQQFVGYVKCWMCERPNMHHGLDPETREFILLCEECGAMESWFRKRDENGDIIKNSDGIPEIDHTVIHHANGAYRIDLKDGSRQSGTLLDEKEEQQFKITLQWQKEMVKYAHISRWDGEKKEIVIEVLINN